MVNRRYLVRMKFFAFCVAVEVVGVAAVGTGIALELAQKASVYYVVISVGSLLITSGGIVFGKLLRRNRGC